MARMSKERRLRGFAPFATQCGRPLYGQNGFYDARATGSTFRSKQPSVDANDAVNLKDGLCDVEADCSDCQHDALLRIGRLIGRCMLIAGARGKRRCDTTLRQYLELHLKRTEKPDGTPG